MRIFVAGKVSEEDAAKKAMQVVKQAGHEITFDWTSIPHLRPYEVNEDASRRAAVLETKGIKESDAVILLAHEHGRGMYVELGMALASNKPVFVVGGDGSQTMFLFHPLVHRVKNISEVLPLISKLEKQEG